MFYIPEWFPQLTFGRDVRSVQWPQATRDDTEEEPSQRAAPS